MISESNKLQMNLFFGTTVIGYAAQAFFKFDWEVIIIPTLIYITLWILVEVFIYDSHLSKSKTVVIFRDIGYALTCVSGGFIVGLGLGDIMLSFIDLANWLSFL